MTRVTLCVMGAGMGYRAHDLAQFLAENGIDAKVVTKHAVQVRPGQEEAAAKLIRKEHPEWLKKNTDANAPL